nr:ribonuclease H-like domain-containing protein [Tanacetum cinerariifolium]
MGLDDSYLAIRSNILSRETLPLVKQAFAIISGEESNRNATSYVTTKPTTTVFAAKAFDNKKRPNNNKNRGQTLILLMNFNANLTVSNNASASADVLAKNSGTDNKTSNSSMSLTDDQLSRLMNLLNDSGVSSANSNMGAKQTREPFLLSDHKSSKIRQLVHLDVWRPYKITSKDGFRYFLTIVDDYYRAVWTYMLKGKEDVYDSIINFVNMLSNQFETNVKVFRSDNSSEFVNNRLQSLFNEKGILHQTSCVYIPQQNGIVERKHRHLLNADSEATSMSENTHPEGNFSIEIIVSSKIDSAGDINDSSEPISEIGDLPVNTVRRSMRQTKLPSSLNEFIINGMVKKPIKCKWIYKIKYKSSRDIERYKARLVAKGFSQREGIDFDETFFPVVKMTTVRCVISLSVENKWQLFQLDVKNAFLYGDLDEEIYMTIPQDFSDKDNKGKVCKLVKSLYGLKQPPRKWNEKLVGVLKDHGFTQSVNDHSLFTLTKKDKFIALLVYVNDIFITGNCVDEINEFKIYLKSKFNIKDLGSLKYFLGIKVIKIGNDLCLTQRKYCLELLKEYGLLGYKSASTPMEPNSVLPYVPTDSNPLLDNITGYQQLLGKLIYLTHTRPDISYSVYSLAELIHSSLKSYLSCALNVLRYLKGAPGKGIKYTHTNNGNNLVGYSDADWAKCVKTRKSVTSYCVFFNNCLISWKSKNRTLCPDHPQKHNTDPCLLPHVKSSGFKNFSLILKLK